jgi:predicted dehydrogenase
VQTALQPIRLAIIGCGAIVEKVRLPTLAGSSDFEVIAVVDPIRERAEALAGGQDVAGIFEDIESLPGTIEAALIATPNQLHATQAVQLLERGIHVCVEKPLAPHASDCERMIEAAEQHGRILMTALDRRYRPQYRRIHRTIANHALGQIQRIIVREGSVHDWPSVSGFYTELGAAGGGVLLDAGIHSLDQLLWWFGEPVSLSYADDACGGPEAECRLELGFSSGTSAQLEFSRLRNLGAVTEIRAEAGTLRLSPWSAKIEFMASPGWPETLPQDVEDPEGNTVGLGGASNLWSDFAEAIRTGSPTRATAADGLKATRLVERCYGARAPLPRPWRNARATASCNSGSMDADRLLGRRVLVTGGSGFLGSRIVEKLRFEHGAEVQFLTRVPSRATRTARTGARVFLGDISDAVAVCAAAAGCDLVIHSGGACNLVYVDDAADAILLAAVAEVATGESFLVSGSQPVTWVDYYRALEGVLGSAGAVETLPLEDLLDRRAASSGQSDSTIEYPDDHFLAELRFPAAVDITRARSALGYRPAFDLAAGMEATRQWAQWAGIAAR